MQGPEKNSYKEFDNEKKFLRLENSPPPPITFLMVRPLNCPTWLIRFKSSLTIHWLKLIEILSI